MSLRAQLEPAIRRYGLVKAARAAGIAPSSLSAWLGQKCQRRLKDDQIERLAAVVGVTLLVASNALSHDIVSRDMSRCHSTTEGNSHAGPVPESR